MTSYTAIGHSVLRTDATAKVTGQAHYAADIHLPGLIHGRILRSPHAHARIVRIEVSGAEALPGVYAVATAADATATRFGQFLQDRTVFACQQVRFIGEPVAAVAAVSPEVAERALEAIEVEYAPLPAIFDPLAALEPDAPILHPELASYDDSGQSQRHGNVRNEIRIQRGEVQAALAEADEVYEQRFSTHPQHPGYIEPHATVAQVDHLGKCTVWTTTKAPFRVRENIARALHLPLGQVRVIVPALGGDFGGKGSATIEPIAIVLARKAGRPVKIVVTREEELMATNLRHPAIIDLTVGARRDGTLMAVRGRVVFDAGAYSGGVRGIAHGCANLQGPYRVEHVDLVGLSVYTNNVPGGQVRAPGAPQTFFAIETAVDELARRLGLDPWEMRLHNAVRAGDSSPTGKATLTNVGLQEVLERARAAAQRFRKEDGKVRGIGVAAAAWALDKEMGVSSGAAVKVNEDGTVVLLTGVTDSGGGQYTIMAQVVAEVLGVPASAVAIVAADTDATPYEAGTGGSMTTYRAGNSVKQAAEDAREQLLALAAERLEASSDDLVLASGRIHVRGAPARGIELDQVARAALGSRGGPILGTGGAHREAWVDALAEAKGLSDAPCFAAEAALVEVDPETGAYEVLDLVAAQDVGFAINPLNVEGQIQGSVSNGLGFCTLEEVRREQGRVMNPGLVDYHMPTTADSVPILPLIVQERSTLGPYGAKGAGEPGITAVTPAIANALYDAVGVRLTETPFTAERILARLTTKPTGVSSPPGAD